MEGVLVRVTHAVSALTCATATAGFVAMASQARVISVVITTVRCGLVFEDLLTLVVELLVYLKHRTSLPGGLLSSRSIHVRYLACLVGHAVGRGLGLNCRQLVAERLSRRNSLHWLPSWLVCRSLGCLLRNLSIQC